MSKFYVFHRDSAAGTYLEAVDHAEAARRTARSGLVDATELRVVDVESLEAAVYRVQYEPHLSAIDARLASKMAQLRVAITQAGFQVTVRDRQPYTMQVVDADGMPFAEVKVFEETRKETTGVERHYVTLQVTVWALALTKPTPTINDPVFKQKCARLREALTKAGFVSAVGTEGALDRVAVTAWATETRPRGRTVWVVYHPETDQVSNRGVSWPLAAFAEDDDEDVRDAARWTGGPAPVNLREGWIALRVPIGDSESGASYQQIRAAADAYKAEVGS